MTIHFVKLIEFCHCFTSNHQFVSIWVASNKAWACKNFDVVIVWKLDRFARNRYDSAMYKAKLKKNGVQVMSAMEAIPDTPEGVMLEAMIEGMAEYYSLDLALKVRRGLRTAREKGEFILNIQKDHIGL